MPKRSGKRPPASRALRPIKREGEVEDLNDKQERFCQEYLLDLNATQAAIRAGYSEKTAKEIGYEHLTKPHIQERVAQLQSAVLERTSVKQDRVILEYKRLAFFDPRKLFHLDGRPKAITEMDDDTAAALAGLEVFRGSNSENAISALRYKFPDKKGSLDSLAKHLRLFDSDRPTDRNQEDVVAEILQEIEGKTAGLEK